MQSALLGIGLHSRLALEAGYHHLCACNTGLNIEFNESAFQTTWVGDEVDYEPI